MDQTQTDAPGFDTLVVAPGRRGRRAEREFHDVFSTAYSSVVSTVYFIVQDRAVAEDIAQDAFVQLLRRWNKIRGYDRPDLNNGAWTGYFVDISLIDHFDYANVSMEECHAYADSQYNPGGGDEPWDGDSDPSIPLHIAMPPAKSEFFDPADVAQQSNWDGSGAGTALSALLEGTARLQVFRREDFHVRKETLPTAALTRPEQIQALLAEVNPSQWIKDRAAKCWFGYSMDIKDAKGNDLGMLGMCWSPTGYYQDHPAVFVMPRENGRSPVRYGLNVPDGAALAALIEDQL